jgi:hypothetical protein
MLRSATAASPHSMITATGASLSEKVETICALPSSAHSSGAKLSRKSRSAVSAT